MIEAEKLLRYFNRLKSGGVNLSEMLRSYCKLKTGRKRCAKVPGAPFFLVTREKNGYIIKGIVLDSDGLNELGNFRIFVPEAGEYNFSLTVKRFENYAVVFYQFLKSFDYIKNKVCHFPECDDFKR
jgi:hypothetical protein